MPIAYKQPMPGRGYTPYQRPQAMTFSRQQLELLDRRNELLRIASGEGTVNNFLYRQRAARIEDQLVAPRPQAAAPRAAPRPMVARKQPKKPVNPPIPQGPPLQFQPVPLDPIAPAPAAPVAAAAPSPAPTSPVEDAAAVAKSAEEDRLRKLEQARADEQKRRADAIRRRGGGITSFLTGGFRGLPTALSSILGV